ncbi:hypothetical protein ABZ071_35560, partial [Micromonospora fulviviridis]
MALTLALAAAAGCDNRREPPLPSVLDKLRESHVDGQAKITSWCAIDARPCCPGVRLVGLPLGAAVGHQSC